MIRKDGYRALRQLKAETRRPLFDKHVVVSDIAVDVCTIDETSPVCGKSIEDIGLRAKTGASIIIIERENRRHASPDPKFSLKTGDIVFITGKREDINKAIVYLTEGKAGGQ